MWLENNFLWLVCSNPKNILYSTWLIFTLRFLLLCKTHSPCCSFIEETGPFTHSPSDIIYRDLINWQLDAITIFFIEEVIFDDIEFIREPHNGNAWVMGHGDMFG